MAKPWYKHAYRRNVVDMHITDYDPQFMTKLDPVQYVHLLKVSKAQSAVVYAHSHVGLTYYPTRVGKMNPNLKGRDIFGEIVAECQKNGIAVQGYYSLIFDTWAYRSHPDWRIIDVEGKGAADKSRYGICCPNSPYRDHVASQIEELCEKYPFEGIRFDMTFWPSVCYCPYCVKRFTEEVGGDIPRTVDWSNPAWVAFQRCRERWLVEFAGLATQTVKRLRPEVSVEHQCSGYPLHWQFGVTADLAQHNDFLQGDFYGGALQGTFVCKLLHDLTPNEPFAFETSIALGLGDHTTIKPEYLVEAKAYRAISNGGAFVFIDAIDPLGTLDSRRYERMGKIFERSGKYDSYLGGRMVRDVGIYFSTESKYNLDENGQNPIEAPLSPSHVDSSLSTAKTLIEANIPYGVVTRNSLDILTKFPILILSNVLMMSREEVEAIRKYVKEGGCLYASRYTSLTTPDGVRQKDFLLSDVFGVKYIGETKESYSYITPTELGTTALEEYDRAYPLGLPTPQVMIQPKESVEVLGTLTLPYTDPGDYQNFTSIHSNPPGPNTDHPAIVVHQYGKGRVIYAAADIECLTNQRWVFANLIRLIAPKPFHIESDAPKPVEITLFDQPESSRYILHLLNFQEEMPNLPAHDFVVRVRLNGKDLKSVTIIGENKKAISTIVDDIVEIHVDRLDIFRMYELVYSLS